MKTFGKALLGYASAASLSLVLAACVLRLWRADLAVPFDYHSDSLLWQTWVKGLIENGWYLHNDRLGAPFGLDMHDFPLMDSLFFLLLKCISLAVPDQAATCNLYFLLTFPLTVCSALFVCRRLGVSYAPALVASLLFTFLPYHFYRGMVHPFLASYFLVPLATLVVLRVYLGRDLFFRLGERQVLASPPPHPQPLSPAAGARGEQDGRGLHWHLGDGAAWGSVAVCVLLGSGGVYYAFFTCYFLLLAGTACSCRQRRAQPVLAAGFLVAVISLTVFANLLPTFLYQWRHGPNPIALHRRPTEPDLLSLKLGHLLLPVTDHRLRWLARVKDRYIASLPPLGYNESLWAALGLAGSVGFLYLLGRLISRRTSSSPRVQDGLTLLTLFALLLGMVGGLGPLLSVLTKPWIRCYNRVSVFIAFFALLALALLLDRALRALSSPRARLLGYGLLPLLLAGGLFDQTLPEFVPAHAQLKKQYEADAAFIRQVEESVSPDTLVYQVPFNAFPEGFDVPGVGMYDHFRAYLHSRTLRWSHGSMRGRQGELWNAWASELPPGEMVRTLACAGFGGICLDRVFLARRGQALEAGLTRLLGSEPLASADGRWCFFNLARYAEQLQQQATPTQWQVWREQALHAVVATCPAGFYPAERSPSEVWHPASGAATLALTNLSDRPRRVALEMTCAAAAPDRAQLSINSPLWTARLDIDGHGRTVTQELIVPPGQHLLALTCTGLAVPKGPEGWAEVFRIGNLTLHQED